MVQRTHQPCRKLVLAHLVYGVVPAATIVPIYLAELAIYLLSDSISFLADLATCLCSFVLQFVDWSTTVPGRTMPFPMDSNGDVDSSVSIIF